MNNSISVIIPTKGERSSINQVIEKVDYEFNKVNLNYEIIIGLDSRNNIENLMLGEPPNRPLQIVQHNWYSPSKARNAAAKLAGGEILIFLDDDIVVTEGWGETVKKISYETDFVIWAGGIDCGEISVLSRKAQEQGAKCFGKDSRYLSKYEYGASGHLIITRNAWNKLGGFNESFGNSYNYRRNEDVELFCKAYRENVKAAWRPNLNSIHLHSKKLSENDYFEQGRSDFAIDCIYSKHRLVIKLFVYIFYTRSNDLSKKRRAQGYILESISHFISNLISVKI